MGSPENVRLDDSKVIQDRIDSNEQFMRSIENKPEYKLETREEYNYRTKAVPKMFGAVTGAIPAMPILAATEGTFEDYTPSSDEDLAEFEDKINKQLDKVVSAPTDDREPYEVGAQDPATEAIPGLTDAEKKELGMPSIPILPTVKAGQQGGQEPPPVEDDTELDLGKKISGTPVVTQEQYNVKDIKGAKGAKSNPRTGRRYAKDIKKLYSLVDQFEKVDDSGIANPDFRKKQLKKGINTLAKELKKVYGDFIDPNTGEFSDERFSKDFYSNLSIYSDLSEAQLKSIFKRISTAKPVKQVA